MRLGIDVSTYYEELEHGAKYFDGGKEVDPLALFRHNGVDCMRIRVWVDPYSPDGKPYLAGTCDKANFLRLAKEANKRGFSVLLDIHYSDFWVDPGKQTVPKGWETDDPEVMAEKVYSYTTELLQSAKSEGIDISFIQVGNEITNGMLWPLGKLTDGENGKRGNFGNLIKFIKAGIKGCREVYPKAEIVLHLERSFDTAIYDEYFTNMTNADVDFDIIGFSYYPYWHGTFEQFFANVEMCKKFGKKLFVVELGYAFTMEDYIKNPPEGTQLVISEEKLGEFPFAERYPLNRTGQAAFVEDYLKECKKHGIAAVFWWEPLWIPGEGICWASEEGQKYIGETGKPTRNEWANQCLFDYEGNKLPAFDNFKTK